MKMIIKMVIPLMMLLSFAACGGGGSSTTDTGTTDINLSGSYHLIDLTNGDSWGSANVLATAVFDGSGSYSITGEYSETGVGANQAFSDSGSYSVNSDGTFSFTTSDPSTLDGAISSSGDIFIYSNVSETGERGIGIAIK